MEQQIWIWLLSGVLGGTSINALFRYLTTRRFQSISLEEKLRAEIMDQVSTLKVEIATLKTELDHWRNKYHSLDKEYTSLKAKFDKLTKG